jgi:hypothetical protein
MAWVKQCGIGPAKDGEPNRNRYAQRIVLLTLATVSLGSTTRLDTPQPVRVGKMELLLIGLFNLTILKYLAEGCGLELPSLNW